MSLRVLQEVRLTSAEVKKTPFTLVVAFGDAAFASASGKLFVNNDVDLEMDVHTQRNTG